jgi:membrane-bound lytic murein transglycosylase B
MRSPSRLLAGLLAIALCHWTMAPLPVQAASQRFAALQERLAWDGFPAEKLQALYDREEVRFDVEGVSLFFRHSEGRLNYARFTTEAAIREAEGYMQRFDGALAQAERTFGVEREVITAILLVETWLGSYLGQRLVFNTLSTLAALDEPEQSEALWRQIPEDVRLERAAFDEKVRRKSGWGYDELKALLRYAAREAMDPLAIRGSYAGALGIAQFMPSNALRLARDGDGDGRVDLFQHPDAIVSVANYLRTNGWRRKISGQGAERVILRYNYSRPYAAAVLKVAGRLKGAG